MSDLETAPDPLRDARSAARFLQSYWQRAPALWRATDALRDPATAAAMSPHALRTLACDPRAESRLVTRRGGRYRLQSGPLEPAHLPAAPARRWTVLVQGVDLHDDDVAGLRERFRFVPDARLDDIMVSLAGEGGGVGPHVDSYDVFLLQVHGRRRWRLAPPGPADWQPGQPLRVLARFEPRLTLELEPGDMLYLPPGWQHDGEGLGPDPCVTASIGFRAPAPAELQVSWLHDLADALQTEAEDAPAPAPWRDDPGPAGLRRWQRRPAELPPALVAQLLEVLDRIPQDRATRIDFLGRLLTEPKATVSFDPPRRPPGALTAWARPAGIALDRRTRMAYHGARIFINGDSFEAGGSTLALLRTLADARRLEAGQVARLCADPDVGGVLGDWLADGWIMVVRDDRR